MNNIKKTEKVLLIISFIIFGIGIILGILGGNEILLNFEQVTADSTGLGKILFLFSSFVPVAIFIYFLLGSAAIVGLMWLVYALIRLFINSQNKKSVLLVIGIIFFIGGIMGINIYANQNYKYLLQYNDGVDWYEIYVYDKKIKVKVESKVVCEETPCSRKTEKFTLGFNEANNQKVNEFIDELFLNNPYNAINIFVEQLDTEQEKIFYAIIHNDESYLNE